MREEIQEEAQKAMLAKRPFSEVLPYSKKIVCSQSDVDDLVSFALDSQSIVCYDYNHRRITCSSASESLAQSRLPKLLQREGNSSKIVFEQRKSAESIALTHFDRSMALIFSKKIAEAIRTAVQPQDATPKEILVKFYKEGFITQECFDLISQTPKLRKKFSNLTNKVKKDSLSPVSSASDDEFKSSSSSHKSSKPQDNSTSLPTRRNSRSSSFSLNQDDDNLLQSLPVTNDDGSSTEDSQTQHGFLKANEEILSPKVIVDKFYEGLAKKLAEKYTRKLLFLGSLLFYDRSMLSY